MKSGCWNAAEWLAKFFNQVVEEKKTPMDWERSTTIPLWKAKENPADCANYRPIRLFSPSMKVSERIIERRIHYIFRLSTKQCGFVVNCGTSDAVHTARLLIEKHREMKKPSHIAILDLEKAFDRVPLNSSGTCCEGMPSLKSSSIGSESSTQIQEVKCRRPLAIERISHLCRRASRLGPLFASFGHHHGRDNTRSAETIPWNLLDADGACLRPKARAVSNAKCGPGVIDWLISVPA